MARARKSVNRLVNASLQGGPGRAINFRRGTAIARLVAHPRIRILDASETPGISLSRWQACLPVNCPRVDDVSGVHKFTKLPEKLVITQKLRPVSPYRFGGFKRRAVYQGQECFFGAGPFGSRVSVPVRAQLPGCASVDIRANVFFAAQDVSNELRIPGTSVCVTNAKGVQSVSDSPAADSLMNVPVVDATNQRHFVLLAWRDDNPICLDAFVLRTVQGPLHCSF